MFNFSGRINGKTYYLRIVISIVLLLGVALIKDLFPNEGAVGIPLTIILLLSIIVWLVFLISQIRQRANDIGWHPLLLTALAWWTPLFFILGFIPGQKQPNKYGPAP